MVRAALAHPYRFRLSRAGVLNVWQYDEQVFEFAGGRLLLRGSNGAGKSKTLEMLLPFVLDGDKQRITASGRHHTSLLWLMLDGYQGQNRVGYPWVEFARTGRRLGAVWVANEGPENIPGIPAATVDEAPGDACLMCVDGRPLAWADGHGTWIEWR